MNMEYLSTVLCLFHSLLIMLYSFQCICPSHYLFSLFLDILFILFLEKGSGGEREGEKHQCVVASQVPPTGALAHIPGMCPDWESNR